MYISPIKLLEDLSGGVRISKDEIAFPAQMMPQIMSIAAQNNCIILGGDVLTLDKKHTYDNWYYQPESSFTISENVSRSIQKAIEYVSGYTKKHGNNFLYTFVISGSYIEGKTREILMD